MKDIVNGQSYARVVAQMQRHASWPNASNSPQHIANMVRQLDRGERVSWWLGESGRSFIPSLSYVLGLSEPVLSGRIRAMGEPEEPAPLWSFSLFPGLRQLDLTKDKPYPGIPRLFFQDDGPEFARLWWEARAGIDARLVSQWLRVRHGWTEIHAQDWAAAQQQLSGHVRVVVTIDDASPAVILTSGLPAGLRRLIVICEHPPPCTPSIWRNAIAESGSDTAPVGGVNWRIVRTAPPSSWIEALLGWLGVRLNSGFEPDFMKIRRYLMPILDDVFESPGDVLDFLGMLDATGFQLDENSSPLDIVKHWVLHVTERLESSQEVLVRSILRRPEGISLLLRLESRRLLQGLPSSLRDDQWANLLTLKATDGADLDRIYLLLQAGDAAAHQEALQLLRPDPVAIVRYLNRVGLLVSNANGTRRFGPRWLHSFIHRSVIVEQIEAGPLSWGELALHAEGARGLRQELYRRVRHGKIRWLERLVSSHDPSFPEYQAAVVLAVEVVGHCVATSGLRHPELLLRLWKNQELGLVCRHPASPPEPLIGFPDAGLATWRRWIFSSLWISVRLKEAGHALPAAPLSPWGWDMLSRERLAMLGDVLRFCGGTANPLDPPDTPTRHAAYELGGAIFNQFGPLRSRGEFPEVLFPAVLVDAVRWGVQPVEDFAWHGVSRLSFGLDVLEAECLRQGVVLPAVLAWCWRVWLRDLDGSPPREWLSIPSARPSDPAVLWKNLPVNLFDLALFSTVNHLPDVWAWLGSDVWEKWVTLFCEQEDCADLSPEIWSHVPWASLEQMLHTIEVDRLTRARVSGLWRHRTPQMMSFVSSLVVRGDLRSSALLEVLLEDASEAGHAWAVGQARDWLDVPERAPAFQAGGYRWLVGVVQQRKPDWRDVFFLLGEHEKSAK